MDSGIEKDQIIVFDRIYYYVLDMNIYDIEYFNICVFGVDYIDVKIFNITDESLQSIFKRNQLRFRVFFQNCIRSRETKEYYLKNRVPPSEKRMMHTFLMAVREN